MNQAAQIERQQVLEAEPHWWKFLESLQKRGMHGMKLIVSDDHVGLRAAPQAVMAGVPLADLSFRRQTATASRRSIVTRRRGWRPERR